MRRSCWCGRIEPCPMHPRPSGNGNGRSPWRNSHKQATFRRIVLARADYRCEHIEHGERCKVTGAHALEAHHDGPAGTYNPHEGRALCKAPPLGNGHHDQLSAELRALGPLGVGGEAPHRG